MAQQWWKPVWTVPAAMRAARATVVVPSLFAITYKVVADPQMALFATFGGFATLVIAGFAGTRRDKLVSHAGLAVAGSLALIIGTLVSGTTWLAAVVTVPVTFAIFFAGIGGPNAASGSTAAMFAFVLPVASAGGAATIPSRLEGWWLASAAGTIAVLLLSPRAPGSRLRGAAADLAGELADRVRAAAGGEATKPEAMRAAKERLRAAFTAAPYRPTGLATADQALSSLVQLLEWGVTQASDAFDGHVDLTRACSADRDLLRAAAGLFDDTRTLLSGQDARPDFDGLEAAREKSAAQLRELTGRPGEPDSRLAAAQAVHAQAIAVVARGAAADALIARSPGSLEATVETLVRTSGVAGLTGVVALVRRHATFRSVWFLNSLRGAVALAAAVAVADLSGVQHGFWVVLGTLSVLRTSAASTGSTAWRALAGTVVGFAVGAALLLGDRYQSGRPVGGAAGRGARRRLRAGNDAVRRRAGGVHRDDRRAVQPARPGGLDGRPAADRGRGDRLRGQPGGRPAVLAARRVLGGRRRPRRRVPLRRGLPDPVRGVGAERAAGAAERGARVRQRRHQAGGRGARVPHRAGQQAAVPRKTCGRWSTPPPGSGWPRRPWPGCGRRRRPRPATSPAPACRWRARTSTRARRPASCCGRPPPGLAGFYEAVADEIGRPGGGQLALVPPPAMIGPALPKHGRPRQTGRPERRARPAARTGPAATGRAASGDRRAPEGIAPAHQLPHPHLLWVQEHLHHLSISARMVSEPALRLAEIRQRPWWR